MCGLSGLCLCTLSSGGFRVELGQGEVFRWPFGSLCSGQEGKVRLLVSISLVVGKLGMVGCGSSSCSSMRPWVGVLLVVSFAQRDGYVRTGRGSMGGYFPPFATAEFLFVRVV